MIIEFLGITIILDVKIKGKILTNWKYRPWLHKWWWWNKVQVYFYKTMAYLTMIPFIIVCWLGNKDWREEKKKIMEEMWENDSV